MTTPLGTIRHDFQPSVDASGLVGIRFDLVDVPPGTELSVMAFVTATSISDLTVEGPSAPSGRVTLRRIATGAGAVALGLADGWGVSATAGRSHAGTARLELTADHDGHLFAIVPSECGSPCRTEWRHEDGSGGGAVFPVTPPSGAAGTLALRGAAGSWEWSVTGARIAAEDAIVPGHSAALVSVPMRLPGC